MWWRGWRIGFGGDEHLQRVGELRRAVIKCQQRTPVGRELNQALMLFVGERRVQHFLQRLNLARQAAVLAVDQDGDEGGIWLGDGENSFSSLP